MISSMALIESDSLVLKTYNLAEADKIVVLFTRDHGIVRAVAKGAKRLKSRFGSGLEPFAEVRVTYFQKDNVELVSLSKVEIIRSMFAYASDPAFLQKFSFLGDLLVAFLPPHDPNETLYRMVVACLEQSIDERRDLTSVSLYFQLWLLRLTGFLPDWSRCHECRRQLESMEEGDLQAGFELLCSKCRRSRSGRRMDGIHRSIVASAMRSAPGEFVEYARGSTQYADDLSATLKLLISHSLGREVASETPIANTVQT